MNYLDVYHSRVHHMGNTTAEIIRNSGIRSFEKWMAQSPFTIPNLSVERNLYFSGIIERNKDKENKKVMYLHVANDIPLLVGDIMNWQVDDGSIEKWLLFQEEKRVNGTYRTFQIIKCNYKVKWINEDGILRESWAYVVSSTDEMIKGNFRTWHNLITPQPNKYAEIMMPRQEVDRGTNFIIEDEGWKLIECDFTSVPGVIYLAMTEAKVNSLTDDLVNDIADTDKLLFPELPIMYTVGEEIIPNDEASNYKKIGLLLSSSDNAVAALQNGKMLAIGPGTVKITMALRDNPAVSRVVEITVNNANEELHAFIQGADQLRLDRQTTYSLVGATEIDGEVTFSLVDTELAEILSSHNNLCVLHANAKNKLGEVVLQAEHLGRTYTKTIRIIPLW